VGGRSPGTLAPRETGEQLATELARLCHSTGRTLSAAESLTGGSVSAALAAASDASDWFRGGLVAYMSEVKHRVLQVPPGPVVSEQAAAQMARGIASLLDADVGLAVTGVGGPDEQDGQPVGTVWVGVSLDGTVHTRLFELAGTPAQIVDQAGAALLDAACGLLRAV
jgi:nicotinamide-nucleotide amidase